MAKPGYYMPWYLFGGALVLSGSTLMCTLEYVSSSFRNLQLIERLRHCHRNNFDLGCLRIYSPDWDERGILLASRLRRDAGIVET